MTNGSQIKFDAIIMFSPHDEFKEITFDFLKKKMYDKPILIDIKEFFSRKEAEEKGFRYRSL